MIVDDDDDDNDDIGRGVYNIAAGGRGANRMRSRAPMPNCIQYCNIVLLYIYIGSSAARPMMIKTRACGCSARDGEVEPFGAIGGRDTERSRFPRRPTDVHMRCAEAELGREYIYARSVTPYVAKGSKTRWKKKIIIK